MKSAVSPALQTTVYDARSQEILSEGSPLETFVLHENQDTEVDIAIEFQGRGMGTIKELVLKDISHL